MPRVHPIIMSLNGGEISPRLEGRVDLPRYHSSVKEMTNLICLPQGGVKGRPGLHFVAEAKYHTKKARLLDFEFSELQNYAIEAGEYYMRFYKDCGQIWTVDEYTKLLLHCNGDDASKVFTDSGSSAHTVTAHGNVQVDTLDKVFGSGSALFPGAVGDYLSVGDHADWFQDTGKFAMDFWFKMVIPPSGNFVRAFAQQYVDANNYWMLYYEYFVVTGGVFTLAMREGGVLKLAIQGAETVKTDGEWHHFAVVRGWGGNANDWAVALDGAVLGTKTDADAMPDFAAALEFGKYWTGAVNSFEGRMDEIRISKGVARWTAAFDPLTVAYPSTGAGGGGALYEVLIPPYLETNLPYIRTAQEEEYMYLVHGDHAPMKLTRDDHDDWKLSYIEFIDGPYEDEIAAPTITPSAVAVAVEKVTNGGFDADSDWTKGANWTVAGGKAKKSTGGANNLSQDTTEVGAEVYRVRYTLDSISGGTITMSIGDTAGTARSAPGIYTEVITAADGTDLTFTPSAAGVVCEIDDVSVMICITLTASADLFQAGHAGALWGIKHTTVWGYVEIAKYTNATTVFAVVKGLLDGSGTAAAGHREGSWSDVNGWPRSIFFNEGRLVFISNYEWPKTVWGSKTREFNDFTPGTGANDAYSFTPADVSVLRWGATGKVMCLGGIKREATAVGPKDTAISATEPPRIKGETTHGSSNLTDALRVGNAILFLQKAGRKIREFVFRFEDDAYKAPDLTALAEHLTEPGINGMIYQQEPDSVIWTKRPDGILLGCTYDPLNKVVGWHRHITDGEIESTISIPYQNMDQVWAIVNRTIGGETKRYIEYLDPDIHVDSGLTYSGAPITSLTGLTHLEGKTVAIVGDGAVYPSQVVTGGVLPAEINPAASEIYVGLPFTPKLITNRPEIQVSGTSQVLKKRWSEVVVRVIDTMGIKINDQVVPARYGDDPMDTAPTPENGDIEVDNLGWDVDGRITIEQLLPLPVEIVCIMGTLVIGQD